MISLEVLAAIGGIPAILLILGYLGHLCSFFIPLKRYNIYSNIFTDRRGSLESLMDMIHRDVRIVNIHGKKGIGKSSFLTFFCDLANNKLDSKNQHFTHSELKWFKKSLRRISTLYIELSGYSDRESLNKQLSYQITGKDKYTIRQLALRVRCRFFAAKKILIVFDNLNNHGLEKEIEDIIKEFIFHSDHFYFAVGSIEEFSFLTLLDTSKDYVRIPLFNEQDIYEYTQKNEQRHVDPLFLAKILDVSSGLPVFINLIMSLGDSSGVSLQANRQLKAYINHVVEQLQSDILELAQYIALISITNAKIQIDELHTCVNVRESQIRQLENNSLIEYDPLHNTIKMHELFRDMINAGYLHHVQDKIEVICSKLCKDHSKENVYYYLVLKNRTEQQEESIRKAVQNAISEENYSFLILLGEHYKRFYEFSLIQSGLDEDTFFMVILGYLEGLIGTGNYPAAESIVDACKLTLRVPCNTIQFELSLLVANLYHLQNKYDLAINAYGILAESAKDEYEQYKSVCYKGIAHSFRHEGKCPILAVENYNRSIEWAMKHNQFPVLIKSRQELFTLYISLDQLDAAESVKQQLDEDMKKCTNEANGRLINLSYKKAEARYIRMLDKDDHDDREFRILMQVLKEFSEIKKRLQYNAYFELAEYYRKRKIHDQAYQNYRVALVFSRKNLDYNLESMSIFGIILCELAGNQFFEYSSREAQIDAIVETINACRDRNLYYNALLANVILATLKNETVQQSIVLTFRTIGYVREAGVCENLDTIYDLYLMLL